MDRVARQAVRSGDRLAQLVVRRRQGDDRCPPWDCPHCGREVQRLEVPCLHARGPLFVRCTLCGLQKCPWGCDAGAAAAGAFCDWRCDGYPDDPKPSPLWPGEKNTDLCCNRTGRASFEWPARLSLMAYCGDAAARALVPRPCTGGPPDGGCADDGGDCHEHQDEWPFGLWTECLQRWPGAGRRAAIEAGRRVQVHTCFEANPECQRTRCAPILRALDAAEDHARCGCSASREAGRATLRGPLPGPFALLIDELSWEHPGAQSHTLHAFAREVGEAAVLAAVCAGLVAWAEGLRA